MAFGSANKTIGVWRVSSEERIKTLIGHSGYINKVVFSPNEEYLASGSSDDTIGMWRVSSGERIKTFTDYPNFVNSLVFSSNGEYLAIGSFDYRCVEDIERRMPQNPLCPLILSQQRSIFAEWRIFGVWI